MSKCLAKERPDYFLFSIFLILIIWGIFTVAMVSFPFSLRSHGHPWYYFWHQAATLMVGILGAIICYRLPVEKIKKWALYIFLINLLLLFFVFFPVIGVELKGARRWVNCGYFLIQPSEFLKISFLVYLAAWLSQKFNARNTAEKIKKVLLPFFIMVGGVVFILIKQPDMSTLGIVIVSAMVMYFLARTSWWHTALMMGAGFLGCYFLIKIAPYRLSRLAVFLNQNTDVLNTGYHLKQSLIAIGSGKIFGIGQGFSFGLSRQKFGFLPDSMTDSIFAIIGEELGFLGAATLVLIFLALAWRGFRLAKWHGNNFQGLLTAGLTFWLTFQAFFNIGGIIGIVPLAGIPLPFFSYGGSHIIAEMLGVGILLNLSKRK